MKRSWLCLIGVLAVLPWPALAAEQTGAQDGDLKPPGSDFHLVATPYLWAPTIEGTVAAGPLALPIRVEPRQLASGVRSGLMGYATADYRRAFLTVELIAVDFKRDAFQPTLGQDVRVKIFSMEAEAGMRLAVGAGINLSPFVGLRHNDLSVALGTAPANLRVAGKWTEPLIGLNAVIAVSPHLNLNGKAAQGFGGDGGRSFDARVDIDYRLSRRFTLFAGYRRLDQEYSGKRETPFRLDLRGNGPMVGIRARL